ncbi:hypothetical protein [Nocardioides sp. CFH 31398]|uniref:hypothetical protein n=1 Tax=Nocardioides sp. CFH 31398 TaxID=2919579 RepID=UPI001F05A20D|nr:hypothetical protein [Nocardioides sp. CFH 31398]MCH1867860.1 hypothetical protein [Nocardioides sp. CFH 31398]
MTVLVLDGGWADLASADHAALVLTDGVPATVATHVVATEAGRRVLLATDADVGRHLGRVPEAVVVDAPDVARAHAARTSGRLVVFRGSDAVTGRPTAAQVVARSEVEAVVGLAGTPVTDETELDLGDFVRPTWRAGRCELLVQAGPAGPRPFEVREQIRCCVDH